MAEQIKKRYGHAILFATSVCIAANAAADEGDTAWLNHISPTASDALKAALTHISTVATVVDTESVDKVERYANAFGPLTVALCRPGSAG